MGLEIHFLGMRPDHKILDAWDSLEERRIGPLARTALGEGKRIYSISWTVSIAGNFKDHCAQFTVMALGMGSPLW